MSHRSGIGALCGTLGLALLSEALAIQAATPWAVPQAHCRLRLDRKPNTPWPARVGVVEVWPTLAKVLNYSVYTARGQRVGAQTLWEARNEPIRVHFDARSGQPPYYLYVEDRRPAPVPNWQPDAGVTVETRRGTTLPAETREQFAKALAAATVVYGRSYTPHIFLGANPHGPSTYYVAIFRGALQIATNGVYGFATASDDASFFRVDGTLAAEWLGGHGAEGGRRGEHGRRLALTPGRHAVEYVQIQYGGGSAAVAAWQPPGQQAFEVIPPSAFGEVAHFAVTGFESSTSAPEELYFEWDNTESCQVDQLSFVTVRFNVLPNRSNRTYRWSFDDGATESGPRLSHVFVRSGLREVMLEAFEQGRCVATNSATVHVHPCWLQFQEWRDDVFDRQRQELLVRDLPKMPVSDLVSLARLAARIDDEPLLNRAGDMVLRRETEFNASHADVFYEIGLSLQYRGDAEDRLAEKALRKAFALAGNAPGLGPQIRLRLAEMDLHFAGKLDEAGTLLASLPVAQLSEEQKLERSSLWGDLLLAQGKVDDAKRVYAAVAAKPQGASKDPALQRAARLESVQLAITQGQFAAAEQLLQEMRAATASDSVALDTGLALIRSYLGRKACQRALVACQRLRPLAEGEPQEPELLLALAEAAHALGRNNDNQTAVRKLLEDYPATEAAAVAKAKWGARAPKARRPPG